MAAMKTLSPADSSGADDAAASPSNDAAGLAALPARLRAALVLAHKHTAWLYSGYTRLDLAVGLQIALGWAVLLGIQANNAVWNWLSQRGASATLVLVVSGPTCAALRWGTSGT